MPAMYGAQLLGHCEAYLYLEYVDQSVAWQWKDTSTSVAVLKAVADVHSAFLDSGRSFDDWDYESELVQSAKLTVELFAATVLAGIPLGERPMLRALERMLPAMRAALKSWVARFCMETYTPAMPSSAAEEASFRLFWWIGVALGWGRRLKTSARGCSRRASGRRR